MPKPKTHARLTITLPIGAVKVLRNSNEKISRQIANSLMATRPSDFGKKLMCRRKY
jgi:hypothetical protein